MIWVVSNTLEWPEGSSYLQLPPTPAHRSKPITSKPFSLRFLTAVIPDGPAPITATFFIFFFELILLRLHIKQIRLCLKSL